MKTFAAIFMFYSFYFHSFFFINIFSLPAPLATFLSFFFPSSVHPSEASALSLIAFHHPATSAIPLDPVAMLTACRTLASFLPLGSACFKLLPDYMFVLAAAALIRPVGRKNSRSPLLKYSACLRTRL